MSRYRNFVFTLNNYTDKDIEFMLKLPYKYLIYGKEIGESGTPHLQGYCELKSQLRLKSLKECLYRAHIDKRKGTAQQAADYCKKDNDFTEHGTISRPGTRNDIESLFKMVKEGKSTIEQAESCPVPWAKYYKACDRLRNEYDRVDNKFTPVKVTVIYGKAGTGKTKKAYEIDPDIYHWFPGDQLWFDGYTGQKTILIDDFYGNIKYGKFLQLIDGYRFNIPIKGGFTWKKWDHVVITSNNHPSTWYSKGMTPALERRISEILVVE